MRVYDQNLTGPSIDQAGKAQETQRTAGSGSSRAAGTSGSEDRVEFSNTLETLSRVIGADDASRAERVDQLAAQYAAGAYQPDSPATSRGMMAEAFAAGGR